MRYSLLLLPLAAVALAGCVVSSPAPRPMTTTTYVTPETTTTYVTPGSNAYVRPGQSTTTTYTNGPPSMYSPPTQTTTTTVRPAY